MNNELQNLIAGIKDRISYMDNLTIYSNVDEGFYNGYMEAMDTVLELIKDIFEIETERLF